jgi:hypothetical protein
VRSSAPSTTSISGPAEWPELPLDEWQDTQATLHRWLQIVGKTRLKLAPYINHYWHVTLYLTARGLTTSPMPYGVRTFEVELDFIDHQLLLRTDDGETRSLPLIPRTVADFYREYLALLRSLGFEVQVWPVPNELEDALPFPDDRKHREYDPEYANRCWRILSQSHRVLSSFRGRFIGKCSPAHFFWGAFDLACTRFSGKTAPLHPGGVTHLPDRVAQESYSHECISAGWWPGGGQLQEPAYYAYCYPEPAGFAAATVAPKSAYYHPGLKEFVLPYEAVRNARRPDDVLLEFFQTTYDAGAELGGWDRRTLERSNLGLHPAPAVE